MSTIKSSTTTTTAYSVTADTTGALVIQTGATPTTAMTIDTSQNVGIGTTSPTQKLQVAGNAFISAGQYFMWDNAGAWSMQSDASTYVRTYINGNEKMRVNAYGIGVGGAIPSSGTGITFPATQSASSDANTLDDYEEGTFTVTFTPATSGTITLSASYKTASYTKVGRLVTVFGELLVSSVSSPIGTSVIIGGLPFAVGSGSSSSSGFAVLDLGTQTLKPARASTTASSVDLFINATTVGVNSNYILGFSYIV